jgi:hypothetical protein
MSAFVSKGVEIWQSLEATWRLGVQAWEEMESKLHPVEVSGQQGMVDFKAVRQGRKLFQRWI